MAFGMVSRRIRPEKASSFLFFTLALGLLLSCEWKEDVPTSPVPAFVGPAPSVIGTRETNLLADGIDSKTVVAYVAGENGLPLAGVPVLFSVSDGGGSISPSAVTDSDGRALATWTGAHSSLDLTVTICAEVPDSTDKNQTANIALVHTLRNERNVLDAADLVHLATATVDSKECVREKLRGVTVTRDRVAIPDRITLEPDRLNIPGRCITGQEDLIVATVYDRFSAPGMQGSVVYFFANFGRITPSATTDSSGRARATFLSVPPFPTDGLVTITARAAESPGNRIETGATILLSSCTTPIEILPDSFTLVDGGSQVFSFTVNDIGGNPLSPGSTILITSTSGTLAGDIDFQIPDVRSGYTDFSFWIADGVPGDPDPPQPAFITIEVTSPNGNIATTISGTVD